MVKPGTPCTLRYEAPKSAGAPRPGQKVRSVPGGACYRIDRVQLGRGEPAPGCRRYLLFCTRLRRDEIPADGRGVWLLAWDRRRGKRGTFVPPILRAGER